MSFKMNETAAIEYALEITKIVCANPSMQLYPCADTAEDVANFIRALEARFTEQTEVTSTPE